MPGSECPLCNEKLQTAHSDLRNWFRWVKGSFYDVHVSWAYRGKEDQEKAFTEGKSKLHFPHSPHNFEVNKKPCSLALDLFQLTPKGVAKFDPVFYYKVYQMSQGSTAVIRWGGTWKSLGDRDHFELMPG